MTKHSDSDEPGRTAARGVVHPRVLRFDDEDTQLTAIDANAEQLARRGQVDPDATRVISETDPPEAHNLPRLPAELVIEHGGSLCATPAEVTDISRDAVFIASDQRPEQTRPVHLRVHSRFGIGTATGQVESHLSGAGFIVRLSAATAPFNEFADEVRAYAEGRGRGCPPLVGPVELHVL